MAKAKRFARIRTILEAVLGDEAKDADLAGLSPVDAREIIRAGSIVQAVQGRVGSLTDRMQAFEQVIDRLEARRAELTEQREQYTQDVTTARDTIRSLLNA